MYLKIMENADPGRDWYQKFQLATFLMRVSVCIPRGIEIWPC